jgi:hypothetical protein
VSLPLFLSLSRSLSLTVPFLGAIAQQRRIYRSVLNYVSGYGILETPKYFDEDKNTGGDAGANNAGRSGGKGIGGSGGPSGQGSNFWKRRNPEREQKHLIVMPLAEFLSYFAEPKTLASRLEKEAAVLAKLWKEDNEGLTEGRYPLGWAEVICRYDWIGQRGREETSKIVIQFNTYEFTTSTAHMAKPKLRPCDITLLIKVSSTYATGFLRGEAFASLIVQTNKSIELVEKKTARSNLFRAISTAHQNSSETGGSSTTAGSLATGRNKRRRIRDFEEDSEDDGGSGGGGGGGDSQEQAT